MKRSRFSEEQIIGILREAEAGSPIRTVCAAHNISTGTYHTWKRKFGGMGSQRSQEAQSTGRRELAAQAVGGRPGRADSHSQGDQRKKVVSPSARRWAVKMSVQEGLGKVAASCRALGLSRSSYYRSGRSSLESRRIRKEVLELSAKHPRYGYRRITALMRRDGFEVNGKRVARIRREEGIKVSKKQRRTKRLGISRAEREQGGAAAPGLELGLLGRPDRKWKQFSHPHFARRTHSAMPGHSSGMVDPRHRRHHGNRSSHSPLWSARASAQRQRSRVYCPLHAGLAEGSKNQDALYQAREPLGERVY
jgi:hypothetical protein